MWIRWQSRTGTRSSRLGDAPEPVWYIAVMETKRENGKPQARVVCYLGSFPQFIPDYPAQRQRFWQEIMPKLDTLNLSEEERTKIENSLAERVPKVTPEEEKEIRQVREAWEQTRQSCSI